ncbi:MAG: hypothetical protein LC635_00580 [Pseudonocardiaceae bacterium]|nr:hypothetical protein [Pseudonocardiaceae bacterium]
MALAEQLQGQVTIDLGDIFADLGGAMTGVDLGDVRFDATGIVELVTQLAAPELAGIRSAVQAVAGGLGGALPTGVPHLPAVDEIGALATRLGAVGPSLFTAEVSAEIGLDALATRVGAVREAVEGGGLAELLGLVPGGIAARGRGAPRRGGRRARRADPGARRALRNQRHLGPARRARGTTGRVAGPAGGRRRGR